MCAQKQTETSLIYRAELEILKLKNEEKTKFKNRHAQK